MHKIETLLRFYNAEFIYKNHMFYVLDIDGRIYEDNDHIYFLHGNCEVDIAYDDPNVAEYIRKYLDGFDEFEEYVNAH